jgi:uncharacterized protein
VARKKVRVFVTAMTAKESWEALAKAGFGRLGCAREGQPYVVPIFFALGGDHIYSFSMAGQKLDWMRDNPRVCLEIDDVKGWNDWMSVVASGRYQELSDTPDWHAERQRAHSLLEQRAMWWQPGSLPIIGRTSRGEASPVFFRIIVERLSGHRGTAESAHPVSESETRGGWFTQLLRSSERRR